MPTSQSKRKQIREYNLNNSTLNTVDVCRDLGVQIDSRLNFSQHIDSVVSRAHLREIRF